MRTVSALDVRKHFGRLLDEAAAGERLVIERAGQPVAALVPLSDLPEAREQRVARRLAVLDEISRSGPRLPAGFDVVQAIREMRDQRDEEIVRAVVRGRRARGAGDR
jgi:prevent-host-death family protein